MNTASTGRTVGAAPIPWHRRLEARVLVGVTLVAGLSLVTVALITGRVVRAHTFERARADITAARAAFTSLITTRADYAHRQTRLITALPVFRAHMTDAQLSSDRQTMEVMADAYRRDLSAAFCIVTASDGRWLASPGVPATEGAVADLRPVILPALSGSSERRIVALERALFLVVAEPATFAGEVLGTFTSAYRLDDAVAISLAEITRSQVALIAGDAVSGSSFDAVSHERLVGAMRAAAARGNGDISMWDLDGSAFIGGTFPLGIDASPSPVGSLVLLEDWAPTQRFVDQIVSRLSWAGAGVFVLAVIGGTALSRRMTRPLRDIADLAGEIAEGNWNRQVPLRGGAEVAAVTGALNEMTRSLNHWQAEAMQRTRQLEAAYERYAAVVNSAPDAIVSATNTGDVILWNRGAASILGHSEAEALGRPLLSFVAASARDVWAQMIAEVTACEGATRSFEGEGLRRDGGTFPFECTLASWNGDGSTFITAMIRDTTERRRAQDALQERDAQLRQSQKMEAIGRLASGVAHDFNNALAVIQGYTEQIMACVGDAHEHYDDLHEVLKASHSAALLTRQLLAFSRKQALEPQVLSLTDVVGHIEKMLRRLAGNDVVLTTRFTTTADRVYADRGQLEQVIVNLCVNARDAMPDGGRLELAVQRTTLVDAQACARLAVSPGEYVTLIVADTGDGMDAGTAAHIFEPFFTTKDAGKGTGLGLSTVYGIVQQSGGGIELETAPSRGTTFRIHLPAAAADDAQAMANATDEAAANQILAN